MKLTEIENAMSNIIKDTCDSINKQKELVIRQKLKEKTGLEIDIIEETKRRFKRIVVVYQNNEESVYFNDGSVDGLRVVTFVKTSTPLDFNVGNFTVRYEENYY